MKHIYNLMIVLFISMLWAGCKDDREEPGDNPAPEGTEYIQFVLNMQEAPGETTRSSGTRAITKVSDDIIETVDVVAFVQDAGTTTKWNYSYTALANITPLADGVIQCRAALKQMPGEKQRFMFLINSRVYFNDYSILQNQTLDLSTAASEDESTKLFNIPNTTGWFLNKATTDEKVIPMYVAPDEEYTIPLPASATSLNNTSNPFMLLRMLARIDVQESATGIVDKSDPSAKIKLTEAYLYQRKSEGYLSHPKRLLGTDNQVTQPWIPDGFKRFYRSTVYNATANATTSTINEVIGRIYTFEAEDADAAQTDRLEVTAIVVGLSKNGKAPTYYRIDIPRFGTNNKPVSETMGPIMRNHCYNITINSIEEEGELTPDEGYEGRTRINTTVLPWEHIKTDEIYDGTYNLWVSKTYIKYAWNYYTQVITHHPNLRSELEFYVSTTHSQGFRFGTGEGTDVWTDNANRPERMIGHIYPNWNNPSEDLGFNYTTPVAPFKYYMLLPSFPSNIPNNNIRFEARAQGDNTTDASRFASYIINAGNIYKYVHLEQTNQNGDWYNTTTVMDWEDLDLAVGGDHEIRLDLERDVAYYDGAEDRNELSIWVTGLAPERNYWVVSQHQGSWIKPNTAPRYANGESRTMTYDLDSDNRADYQPANATDYNSTINERVGKVEVRLANVIKRVKIIQYDKVGMSVKPDSHVSVVNGVPTLTIPPTGSDDMYEIELNTARKGCEWEATTIINSGELLAGIRNAKGTGSGKLALWINRNVHEDATATIQISAASPNRQEFKPVTLNIIKGK